MPNISGLPTWWAGGATISPTNMEAGAANGTSGAVPLIFWIDVPDAATGDVTVTLPFAIRVLDCWAVKTAAAGGAANTVQLKNGSTAITDALSININDQTIARATTINDAQHDVTSGTALTVTRTKAGGNAACIVYVAAVRT